MAQPSSKCDAPRHGRSPRIPQPDGPPRILFLFALQQHSLRQVLRGVMRHARTHSRPEVQFSGHGGLSNLDTSRDRRPFAAIGNWGSLDAGSRALLVRPECRGLVQIRDGAPEGEPESIPTATLACDNAAIGRAAADLFAGKRRTNFGFVGVDWDWSIQRQESFAAGLRERGFECPVHVILRRKINWRSAKAALALLSENKGRRPDLQAAPPEPENRMFRKESWK